MVLALLLLNSAYMFAQSLVTGTVKDSNGEELIGVSVIEKGSKSNGTVTGVDGKYSIKIAQGKTLVFSYIGYTTKEVVVKGSSLNVTLDDDSKMLNDVVVIGYGSMQRKDVTSSITSIKSEDLNKGVFTDPAQMLQGKVPGLVVSSNGDPNGSATLSLRGASSLRSDAMSPYYVIDGIPGVDISMVAPEDIESIDVLRDATATAIYGSKAANGVIIITTKKGQAGKTNVTYNGYLGVDEIANTLDMMDADGLRGLTKYGINIDDNGGNTNWQDEVLRTAVSHNHNITIVGGNDKTKYNASVTYNKRQGIVKGTERTRLNVRSLLTTSVLKNHLDLSLGANLVYGTYEGVAMNWHGESVVDAMNYYSPLNPIYNADGTYFRANINPDKNYNPLSMIDSDTGANNMKRQQFIAKASLHIIKGLDWHMNYSFNNNQRTHSTYNAQTSQVVPSKYNGKASRSTWFGKESTFETYGNYEKTFNDTHKLGLMAGYSWEEIVQGDGFGVSVNNFYNDDLKWYNLGYASYVYEDIKGISSGAQETIRNISFYGRVNYSYKSRYMLQATMRRDGSSVFGKNHQWGTFPSVSVAWNITEENFMKNQNIFSSLKLRAGYGVSGNAHGFGAYTSRATYGLDRNSAFDYTENNNTSTYYTIQATKNENPDLKWESTGMFNVGLDYAFLGGRINGSIEFYNKKTWDLIWDYPVNNKAYSHMKANVGEITNRGIEFTINADVIQSKNFRWNTTLNLSHNMNRVDKISNETYKLDNFYQGDPDVVSSGGYTQNIMEGHALGTFYLYEFAGFENGRAVYYEHDNDGNRTGNKITDTELNTDRDRVIAGCAQPKINLGWNNNFSYKNWSASFFLVGQFGNKIYNGTRATYLSTARLSGAAGTKNVLKDYTSEMVVNGKVITDPNIPSDRWLENGSYLRLQTLTLGYTFKNGMNGWVNSIQLYGTVNNLFTITSYKGIDPEVNLGGIDPGVDYSWSIYPHTRTYMIGAKINF